MPSSPRKRLPLFPKHKQWQACYDAWLASLRSPKTQKNYASHTRRFFAFVAEKYGAHFAPDQVRRVDIEKFLRSDWSTYTYNAYVQALHSFFGYASGYEVLFRGKMRPLFRGKQPTAGISRARTEIPDRAMTEDDVARFFAAIDRHILIGKRDYALFWTLFITGRRRMEISQLRRGDLERVALTKNGVRYAGWLFWFRGKMRTERESAEMPEDCLDAIRDFHQAAGRDFETMDPNQALFPGTTLDSREPLGMDHVSKRFRSIAQQAGLPGRLVTHSLRWCNAHQRYLANGKDLMKVVEELGWKSPGQAAHYIRMGEKRANGDQTAASIAAKFRR